MRANDKSATRSLQGPNYSNDIAVILCAVHAVNAARATKVKRYGLDAGALGLLSKLRPCHPRHASRMVSTNAQIAINGPSNPMVQRSEVGFAEYPTGIGKAADQSGKIACGRLGLGYAVGL